MVAELITWDANCEDVLCDSVLGHYVYGNLRHCHANAQVWEEITNNLNAHMGKAFTMSDEECALEDELANANDNASAPTHLDDDCYTPNFDTFLYTVEDAEVEEVSRKSDRVSEMTVPLREYTAMSRDKFSGKLGKGSGSSEQFAQSAVGGDPYSLPKAMEVLNLYGDLSNKVYIKMSKVLQQKDDRVVFMCMPEHRRKSWIEAILNPEED
nr:hypothetical protein CFP56_06490 [Quercus suber]